MLEERRALIVKKLQNEQTLKVKDLIKLFGVSNETIRRDLECLETSGYLQRVYGGAIKKGAFGQEPSYDKREVANYEAKKAIAHKAADLIKDGDVVFIDIGTTCCEVAKLLGDKKNLKVITNSFLIANELTSFNTCRVIVLGGELRNGEFSLSGCLTIQNLKNFNADKAVIGAGGLTIENGITDYNSEEACIRKMMIKQAKYTIVVCDSSKIGITAMSNVCGLETVGILITDNNISRNMKKQISDFRVPLMVVPFGNDELLPMK